MNVSSVTAHQYNTQHQGGGGGGGGGGGHLNIKMSSCQYRDSLLKIRRFYL